MPITPEERDEIMRLAWHWKQCIVGSKGSVEANDALSAYLDTLTEQEPSNAG